MMADIDRDMAEKVMEWEESCDPDPFVPHFQTGEGGTVFVTTQCAPYDWFEWHPSTDISQALGDGGPDTVVGKMRKKGYACLLAQNQNNGTWLCEFWPIGGIEDDYAYLKRKGAEADTPKMAICLAAKKAVNDA